MTLFLFQLFVVVRIILVILSKFVPDAEIYRVNECTPCKYFSDVLFLRFEILK